MQFLEKLVEKISWQYRIWGTYISAFALWSPPPKGYAMVRATVKLSAALFHDESSK